MAQLRQGLFAAMEPVVQVAGYELVEVEMVGAGREAVLRIYIDRLPGAGEAVVPDSDGAAGEIAAQGGITVDDCEKVSRALSEWLDVEDPIAGAYYLEVSSPGFDRPLRTAAHFAAQVGQRVKVETTLPVGDRRRFTGNLLAVEGDEVVVDVDGQPWRLPLAGIARARVVPVW
jgi:ribosome maturation factor RimP